MRFQLLSTLAVATLVSLASVACSATTADDAASSEAAATSTAATRVESGKTESFSGTFAVPADGHTVKFAFKVSQIDWSARTARWDAKPVDRDGVEGVTDDIGVPMTILIARCPGCFVFVAPDLAELTFTNATLSAVSYSGYDATEPRVTSASANAAGGAEGASCMLTCEGQVLECSEGGSAATCNPQRFAALPRCRYEVTFASATCASRTPNAGAETGSCAVVCEGQTSDCKNAITKDACTAALFTALPRCRYSLSFTAGATCAQ